MVRWRVSLNKCFSVAKSCPTLPWTATHQVSLSFIMFIESVMPSNHLILCWPLLLPSLFPSIRVFSNESILHIRWPKYLAFRWGDQKEPLQVRRRKWGSGNDILHCWALSTHDKLLRCEGINPRTLLSLIKMLLATEKFHGV